VGLNGWPVRGWDEDTPMNATLGPSDRETVLQTARNREYDLAVIGGGIAGAGVARDAAMRGLDTVLIEQTDFGSGTTAWSTRLIHGGLRYLEQFDFHLVFESLQERETLAEIAPHLVEPLKFLIPQYDESLPARLKVGLGMVLYDVLSYDKTMPWHDRLSRSGMIDLEPSIPDEGLQGGFVYHDRQVEYVERLCLETVLDASIQGADVLNHTEVTGIRSERGDVSGVSVRDRLGDASFDIESNAVMNATGPWADAVLGDAVDEQLVRPTKGIHAVVPKLTEHALTLPTSDGRVIFVVPWNEMSLLGTTDTDFEGDPAEASATAADVSYLLGEASRFFPDLSEEDVLYTYAGVRPLYDSDATADASDVSRRHKVVDHGNLDGLFSLVGAKITPYRQAAEDATDAIADYLGTDAPCRTEDVPLPGARGESQHEVDLPQPVLDHLIGVYGTRTDAVVERVKQNEALAEPLCEHTDDILAQVVVAVEEEGARTLADVMLRRCTVGYEECEGLDAVGPVLAKMGELLDWSEDRKAVERERYERIIDRRHAFSAE
jgi:glycerol-3-phosphate dehydrogenase